MPRPKLHHSIADEIVALAREGYPPREIEEKLAGKASRYAIYCQLAAARKAGLLERKFTAGGAGAPGGYRHVPIPGRLMPMIGAAAAARKVSAPVLAALILERVFDGNLVDAVLGGSKAA